MYSRYLLSRFFLWNLAYTIQNLPVVIQGQSYSTTLTVKTPATLLEATGGDSSILWIDTVVIGITVLLLLAYLVQKVRQPPQGGPLDEPLPSAKKRRILFIYLVFYCNVVGKK